MYSKIISGKRAAEEIRIPISIFLENALMMKKNIPIKRRIGVKYIEKL